MLSQPGSSSGKESPGDVPSRSGIAIGVVHGIDNPAPGIEEIFCRLPARWNQTSGVADQRFMTFGQVGYLGRPVNHLLIDVHMIIGRPGSTYTVVPFSLQIHKHGSWPRTGYHQVATVLKIKHFQANIRLSFEIPSLSLIGWQVGSTAALQL